MRPVVRFRGGDPALVASALVVFAMFVRGAYDRCPSCGVVEPHRFDPASVRFDAVAGPCPCGDTPVPAGRCDASVWLDADAPAPIHLPTVSEWLGIGDLVVDSVEPGTRQIDAQVITRNAHDPMGGAVERIDGPATLRCLVDAHRRQLAGEE